MRFSQIKLVKISILIDLSNVLKADSCEHITYDRYISRAHMFIFNLIDELSNIVTASQPNLINFMPVTKTLSKLDIPSLPRAATIQCGGIPYYVEKLPYFHFMPLLVGQSIMMICSGQTGRYT